MVDISRRFSFECFDLERISKDKRKGIKKELIASLVNQGYSVLESNDSFCGVPINFLVKGPIDSLTKDFLKYSEELGLKFKLEEWYIEPGED